MPTTLAQQRERHRARRDHAVAALWNVENGKHRDDIRRLLALVEAGQMTDRQAHAILADVQRERQAKAA